MNTLKKTEIVLKNFVKNHLFYALFAILFLSSSCQQKSVSGNEQFVQEILKDSTSFFYLDTKNYPRDLKTLPVGVFDSGTGGLTVLEAIIKFDQFENGTHHLNQNGDGIRDFQAESFIYLGDQANMPYGNYSRENKVLLLKEHILKDAQFLLGTKYYKRADEKNFASDKKPVKAIVVACNTATAFGKSDIEQFIESAGLNIKVIGVIDAAVRAAFSELPPRLDGSIGVMATAGTVASNGYVKAIRDEQKELQNIEIFQQAGIGLAGAIDGSGDFIDPDAKAPRKLYKGPSDKNSEATIDLSILTRYGFNWEQNELLFTGTRENPSNIQINSIENYISYHLVSLMEQMRKADKIMPLKSIILGCTHYPYFINSFRKKLDELYNYQENGTYVYRPYMAQNIALINPAENTALELYEYLRELNIFNHSDLHLSEFYISRPNVDNPSVKLDSLGNFPYEYKYGRVAGQIQQYVKRVLFSRETIPDDVAKRLEESVPASYELIKIFNSENPKMSGIPSQNRF